jgi:hypothetical protein
MKHQFYIEYNPKTPADPRYILHAKPPRFRAEIKGDSLEIVEIIDEAPKEKIESKFKRMHDWYRDYLLNKDKYDKSKI